MGEVRRVFDQVLGRVVARKQLRSEIAHLSLARQRFVREARLTAQLQHPGVIPVHDFFDAGNGETAFTMKEVRGRTLADVAAEVHAASSVEGWEAADSGWTFDRMIEAFGRVCETVAYAHANGIVHRDLKPQNVMVGEYGEVLVVDWGLARRIGEPLAESAAAGGESGPGWDPRLTGGGRALGTPAYMSPEQAAGRLEEVDQVSDVWSLGGVLYELLTGSPPYDGDTSEAVLRLAVGAAGPPPIYASARIPAELAAITRRAMARERVDRYADAGELAAEVRAWQAGTRVGAHSYSAADLLQRFVRRHRPVIGATILTVTLLMSAGAVSYFRMAGERDLAVSSAREGVTERGAASAALQKTRLALALSALDGGNAVDAAVYGALALQSGEDTDARGVVMATSNAWMPTLVADFDPEGCSHLTMLKHGVMLIREALPGTRSDSPECRGVWSDTGVFGAGRLVSASSDGSVAFSSSIEKHPEWRARTGNEPVAGVSTGSDPFVDTFHTLTTHHLRTWRLPAPDFFAGSAVPYPVAALDLSPDGKAVAVCDHHGNAAILPLDGGTVRTSTRPRETQLRGLAYDAAGELTWLTESGIVQAAGTTTIGGVDAWQRSPDRQSLALLHDSAHALAIVRLSTPVLTTDTPLEGSGPSEFNRLGWGIVAASTPGNLVGFGALAWDATSTRVALSNTPGILEIHAAPSGALLARATHGIEPVRALAWSPEGSRIAAARSGGAIDILHADTLATDFSLTGAPHSVLPIAFSPDGRLLAAEGVQTDFHGIIALWDLADHRVLARIPSHHGRATALQFTSDGTRIVAGYEDGAVRVWALDDIFTPATDVLARTLQRMGLRLNGARMEADPAWAPTTAASH